MKKLFVVLVLFVGLLLVGCGEAPTLEVFADDEVTIKIGEHYSFDYVCTGTLKVELSDPTKVSAEDRVVLTLLTGLEEGDCTVTVSLEGVEGYEKTILVHVVTNMPPVIKMLDGFDKDVQIETGDVFDEMLGIVAEDKEDGVLTSKVTYNEISTANAGTYTIKYSVTDNDGNTATFERTVTINERDVTAPVVKIKDGEPEIKTLSYGVDYDASDIEAIDETDGDVKASVKFLTPADTKRYNVQTVVMEFSDSHGNKTTIERKVQVKWDYKTMYIGHAGSYYGIQNTEEAFLAAAKSLHYQALECDLKQTSDGVFVTCHDDTFGGKAIGSMTYAKLKEVEASVTRNSGFPATTYHTIPGDGKYTSTICTLERYLEICKEYGLLAIIELKSSTGIANNDQSRMSALMQKIKDCGMIDNVAFLGSAYNCLIWVKENGYKDIPCQYLVNSLESDTYFDRCVKYGFEISINVTGGYSNSDTWLQKYQNAGIKVSTWTFSQYVDYAEVQKWIDKGVDYVTCDWHEIENLTNYKKDEQFTKHEVTVLGKDDKELYRLSVKDGCDLDLADAPEVSGYIFNGWDQSLINITSDMTVRAMYSLNTYSITYKANDTEKQTATWATKDDFVNEFYGDLFDWLATRVGKMNGLTKTGSTYKLVNNSSTNGTATWTSASDIKALNVYVFEAAISSHIYKTISGTNSADYVPVADEEYFLNCDAYRIKYQGMNAYLLNCMNVSYTSYSKVFKPASNDRVQIFFRFHQWCNGTKIAVFDSYPTKTVEVTIPGLVATMPTEHLTYTFEDEFTLPTPTVTGATFLGWYTNANCTGEAITKIAKNSSGDLVLYAKWELLN